MRLILSYTIFLTGSEGKTSQQIVHFIDNNFIIHDRLSIELLISITPPDTLKSSSMMRIRLVSLSTINDSKQWLCL